MPSVPDYDALTYEANSMTAKITVDGVEEVYDATYAIEDNLSYVKASEQKVLKTLSIDEVVVSLERAVDLMYLALNGVAGTGTLAAEVTTHQINLMEFCGTVKIKMKFMGDDCLDINDRFADCFWFLMDEDEDSALDKLSSCEKEAKNIQTKCNDLSKDAQTLRDEINQSKNTTLEMTGQNEQDKEARRLIKAALDSSLAKQIEEAETANQQIEAYNTEIQQELDAYNTTKNNLDKARRANEGIYIAGRVCRGVMTLGFSEIDPAPKKPNKQIRELESQLADAKRVYQETIKARAKVAEERVTALGEIAKLQTQIENAVEQNKLREAADAAIEIATFAFANIFTQMSTAKLFWTNMANFCRGIRGVEIQDEIEDALDFDDDLKDRMRNYTSPSVVGMAIKTMVGWRALANICFKFETGATKAYRKAMENTRNIPTVAQARANIQTLSTDLKAKLAEEQQEAQDFRDEMNRAKEAAELGESLGG